MKLKTYL